jgi:TPR repeat protein
LLVEGRGGAVPDEAEAVRLFQAAAAQDEPDGLVHLAFMTEEGRGGLPRDREKAIALYRRAAALGDAFSVRALKRLGAS